MNRLFTVLSLFLLSFHTQAQTISLVKEIFNYASFASLPAATEYKEYGGALYFATGKNLWKTDGTGANTTLIKSFPLDGIFALTAFKNKLYFLADDSVHGLELWSTSGTPGSTAIVKDIYPGRSAGFNKNVLSTSQIRILNGYMYFTANDSLHGYEVYKSDGTAAGTNMIIDLDPAPGSGSIESPGASLTVFNNRIFFGGFPGSFPDSSRWGIWSTDGTDTGTHLVHRNSGGFNFFVNGNKMYFTNPTYGFCVTDGTAAGIIQLDGSIDTSLATIDLKEYAVLNNEVYFTASDRYIHVTDGTVAGTRKLVPYNNTARFFAGNIPYQAKSIFLTAFNNKVYYSSADSLWSTDGTTANTRTILPGNNTGRIRMPVQLTVASGKLYFKSADSLRAELWVTDGTNAGTYRIGKPDANIKGPADIITYYIHCGIRHPVFPYNNQLFYVGAYDSTLKAQLYKFDPAPNAVPNILAGKRVHLFPNPSTGLVSIDLDKPVFDKLSVIDIMGRTIQEQAIGKQDQHFDISLDNAAPGLYYLHFTGPDARHIEKLVLQR